MEEIIASLYKATFDSLPDNIIPLPQAGSDRRYFRFTKDNNSVIGVYNPDIDENNSFFYFTNHFYKKGFPVPKLIAVSSDELCYLLSDLGDNTLFIELGCAFWEKGKINRIYNLLKKSLKLLAHLQVEGAKGLDFSKCYPKSEFDLQSILWDFNYFKYCFLKPSGIKFNETKLDTDFLEYAKLLQTQPSSFFLYRDFQSRNIMLVDDEPYLIDYQSGRRGPLLYDVASFLYQAKANFPQWLRDEMLDYYIEELSHLIEVNTSELRNNFPLFALFRVIQTLGAYGYRGFFERRAHFLQSVPLAAENIGQLANSLSIELPTLKPILLEVFEKYGKSDEQNAPFDGLTIEISSFSFKKGYPLEHPEHGGGFVFDCRALPNPGRLEKYKHLTGLDEAVIDFFNHHNEVAIFFERIAEMVEESVNVYAERGFSHLSVSFGCTGGQHRSVFLANKLAKRLNNTSNIKIILKHRELQKV